RLRRLAVHVQLGVRVDALPLEAYPAVEAGPRRVVVAHVPFADVAGYGPRGQTGDGKDQRASREYGSAPFRGCGDGLGPVQATGPEDKPATARTSAPRGNTGQLLSEGVGTASVQSGGRFPRREGRSKPAVQAAGLADSPHEPQPEQDA